MRPGVPDFSAQKGVMSKRSGGTGVMQSLFVTRLLQNSSTFRAWGNRHPIPTTAIVVSPLDAPMRKPPCVCGGARQARIETLPPGSTAARS